MVAVLVVVAVVEEVEQQLHFAEPMDSYQIPNLQPESSAKPLSDPVRLDSRLDSSDRSSIGKSLKHRKASRMAEATRSKMDVWLKLDCNLHPRTQCIPLRRFGTGFITPELGLFLSHLNSF